MLTVRSFTFNPVEENTYLVYNEEKNCAVIDPGCYFGNERNELRDFITEKELNPVLLLNTHCHLDHVFGNKFIYDTYGLPLHLHPLEQQVLEYAPVSGEKWNLPFDNYKGPLRFLQPGELIPLGKDMLKVLFTPGHAPGHVVFYCEAQGFVIGGDVLFNGSIGRTDLPLGDHDTLLNSIRTQLLVLPDDVVVYPGHGPQTTIDHERKNNPFLRFD